MSLRRRATRHERMPISVCHAHVLDERTFFPCAGQEQICLLSEMVVVCAGTYQQLDMEEGSGPAGEPRGNLCSAWV